MHRSHRPGPKRKARAVVVGVAIVLAVIVVIFVGCNFSSAEVQHEVRMQRPADASAFLPKQLARAGTITRTA